MEQLSKSTGEQKLYWFYNILSTDTHGFNAIRKFNVTNMDETISTVELIEEINDSSSATNLKPFLSRILIDVINHYKL